MAQEKQTFKRRTDPLYSKLKGSPKFIASVMSETGLNPAVAAEDPLEASMPGAVAQAEYRQRSIGSRKQADHEQRQAARTPAAKAAQGVLADVTGEQGDAGQPASEQAAQAKALVAQFTPEEMELVREAILDREVDELPTGYVAADEPDEGEAEAATWEMPDSDWNAQFEEADEPEEGEAA